MADSPKNVQYTDSMRAFADKFNELVQFAGGIENANKMLDEYVKEQIERLDLAITNYEVPDNGITTAKLKDLNVTTPKLNNLAVTEPKLGDKAVTTPKLNDSAVTTPKLGDKSVTVEKLHDAVITGIGSQLKMIQYGNFYVDGVSGNDSNDGLTKATAVKTLTKMGEMLSNSRIANQKLVIQIQAVGTTYGAFTLQNIAGEVHIRVYLDSGGQPENDSKIVIASEGTVLSNISKLFMNGLSFKPTVAGQNSPQTLQISAIPNANIFGTEIDNTVNIARVGVYAEYTNLYLSNCTLRQCTTALSLSTHASVICSNTKFESSARYVSLLGADYLEYSMASGHAKPTILDGSNSSVDFGLIKAGIMVESSSNANGRYIKFQDGTLICIGTKQLSATTSSPNTGEWTFPAAFINDSINAYPAIFVTNKAFTVSLDMDLRIQAETHSLSPLLQCKVSTKGAVNQVVTFGMMAVGRWK